MIALAKIIEYLCAILKSIRLRFIRINPKVQLWKFRIYVEPEQNRIEFFAESIPNRTRSELKFELESEFDSHSIYFEFCSNSESISVRVRFVWVIRFYSIRVRFVGVIGFDSGLTFQVVAFRFSKDFIIPHEELDVLALS